MASDSGRPLPLVLNPLSALTALARRRELLLQFIARNVELRHKGSHLGLVWAVLNPLLMLALYVFVFGFVFDGSFKATPDETRWDYALAIFLGLSMHHLLAEAIALAPNLIVANANLVKKVVFPLEILPAAAVGGSFVHFGISLGLMIVGIATVGPGLSPGLLWLPVIILPLVLLALGLAWLLAALGTYFRDIGQTVGAISLGLLFASAIFYPAASIPPEAWIVLRWNPLLWAVELARDVALWDLPLQWRPLLYLYGCGLLASTFGFWSFSRLRNGFADVL